MSDPFWLRLYDYGNATALVDAQTGTELSYFELAETVEQLVDKIALDLRSLVFTRLDNTIDDILVYLALLVSGHVPYIFSSKISLEDLEKLVERYQPQAILGCGGLALDTNSYTDREIFGRRIVQRVNRATELHNQLGLLLSTSGSTGSKRLVRLSEASVAINAKQVSDALMISSKHRASTSVPLSYVYGLSVLNSHLEVGASILVDSRPTTNLEFWKAVNSYKATTISGVPWGYQMMSDLNVTEKKCPAVRYLTSSGSKMPARMLDWIAESFPSAGLFLMYGQTEATGRISVLPPECLPAKSHSAGRAVPGGALSIGAEGDVIYRGPNVMMGYAEAAVDLMSGDTLSGVLATGDIGHLDEDGCLYLTGRKNRYAKIFGMRLTLDEIQSMFAAQGVEALVTSLSDNALRILYRDKDGQSVDAARVAVASKIGLPRAAFLLEATGTFERNENGKLVLSS